MLKIFIVGVSVVGGFSFYLFRERLFSHFVRKVPIPEEWKEVLNAKVDFYKHLSPLKQRRFEEDIREFLASVTITGVKVNLTIEDHILVASSGVIPLFGFPECTYKHLEEVIIYPSNFNSNFELDDPNEAFSGMVGAGILENKMILSQPALHAGFEPESLGQNVGLHEFIHIFDKENGFIDGVPLGFEDKSYALPWLELIYSKIEKVRAGDSEFRSYASNSQQDFFAVAGEYFFEKPHELKRKHPELYKGLMKAFNQDTAAFIKEN